MLKMMNPKRLRSSSPAAAAQISVENAHGGSQSNEEDEMKIFLKVMKTVTLTVKKSDTIENVKVKFRDVEGVPENLQELFFAGNRLSDGKKLADSNIQNYSTLNMVVHSMIAKQIFIKIPVTGRTLALDVKPWDTIQSIKAIIHKEEQVPPEQQRLIYAGRTLEDGHTLATYFIKGTPTLHLIIHPRDEFQVFIKAPGGKTIPLEVKMWYKVEDVKAMIESMLGFPLNLHRIVYAGQVLVDNRTLINYKISQGSTLHLIYSGLVKEMHSGLVNVTEGESSAKQQGEQLKQVPREMNKKTVSATKSATKASTLHSGETPKTEPKRKRPSVEKASENLNAKDFGEDIVGCKIKVWWPSDKMFYNGKVDSYDPVQKKHKILYDDGDEEILVLKNEGWEFLDKVPEEEKSTSKL